MQNKSLITGVALSAIAIVGIVTAVNVSNMQKASSTAAVAKANLSTTVVDTKPVTEIGSAPPVAPQPKDQPVINYTFTKTLSIGMKGEEVKKLQQVLAENVYYEGEITGVMDKLTAQELKDFQVDNGLTTTGTTGPKTRVLLTELSRNLGPCAGGNPAIRVRKPNGGEVYQAGQQINVKWRSCHISHGDNVRVDLLVAPFPPIATNGTGLTNTINDGQELIALPQAGAFNGNPMSFGNNFKVFIWHSATGAQDLSNNLFTINGSLALPVVVTADFPATGTTVNSTLSSGTQIARFKITNNSSVRVTLNNIRLTDAGSHSGTSSTYWLYASDENMNNYTATNIGGRLNSFDFTPLAYYPIIHPGSYRYITVVINNTSGIQTGDTFSLGVRTNGDVNYYVSEQDLGYDANGDGDMIDRISNLPTTGTPQLGTVIIGGSSPVVLTNLATSVGSTSVTLEGDLVSGSPATGVWFDYGLSGFTNQTTHQYQNSNHTFSAVVTWQIFPGATYQYRACAQNTVGIACGFTKTFTTPAGPISNIQTYSPTNITTTSAMLNGFVDPAGNTTTSYFRWGTGATSLVNVVSAGGQSVAQGISANLTGLTPSSTYFFQACSDHIVGNICGSVVMFSTL